jgi:hypothetical protein
LTTGLKMENNNGESREWNKYTKGYRGKKEMAIGH